MTTRQIVHPTVRTSADNVVVRRLLARAEGELAAAAMVSQEWERYLHGHLAAVRAAAAIIALRGKPHGRRVPKDVWGLAQLVAPELSWWWSYFEMAAQQRSAIEAGDLGCVDEGLTLNLLETAYELVDLVRAVMVEEFNANMTAAAS